MTRQFFETLSVFSVSFFILLKNKIYKNQKIKKKKKKKKENDIILVSFDLDTSPISFLC